ncbi:MAG: hypothetical protein WC807_00185 [Hyphomicrobium sp.]|jgi:hypothetical protein
METSITLAKIIGPFYLLIGAGLFANRAFFEKVATEIAQSPALFYIVAILSFVIGAVMVSLHNVWTGWPILITLIGWAGVAKGAIRILTPTQSNAFVTRLLKNPNMLTASALIALALGALLTVMGFGTAL